LRHCAPSKTRGDRRREESRLIGDGHHTGGRHGVESKAKAQSARQADISDAEIHDTVRRLSGEFGRAVPSTLQSIGSYVPRDGDPWWHREYGVPDGSYRVAGADLVLRFEDGWLNEVIVPKPPDYGGRNVGRSSKCLRIAADWRRQWVRHDRPSLQICSR
jgi:hypothetical protein